MNHQTEFSLKTEFNELLIFLSQLVVLSDAFVRIPSCKYTHTQMTHEWTVSVRGSWC